MSDDLRERIARAVADAIQSTYVLHRDPGYAERTGVQHKLIDSEYREIGMVAADAVLAVLGDRSVVSATPEPERPLLGLATTRELLDELRARIEVDYFAGGGGLDYTTINGRPAASLSESSPVVQPEHPATCPTESS